MLVTKVRLGGQFYRFRGSDQRRLGGGDYLAEDGRPALDLQQSQFKCHGPGVGVFEDAAIDQETVRTREAAEPNSGLFIQVSGVLETDFIENGAQVFPLDQNQLRMASA